MNAWHLIPLVVCSSLCKVVENVGAFGNLRYYQGSETDVGKAEQLKDANAVVGQLFEYTIPATWCNGAMHPQVTEGVSNGLLPSWLHYSNHTLQGVPTAVDSGAVYLQVFCPLQMKSRNNGADSVQGVGTSDVFVVNVGFTESGLRRIKSGSSSSNVMKRLDCLPYEAVFKSSIIIDHSLHNMKALERVNTIRKMASFLSLDADSISLLPAIDKNLGRLIKTSVLAAGPGNLKVLSTNEDIALSWTVACGTLSKTHELEEILDRNVKSGRVSSHINHDILGWRITKDNARMDRPQRARRQAIGTPVPTPVPSAMPTLVTDASSFEIAETSSLLVASSSVHLSESSVVSGSSHTIYSSVSLLSSTMPSKASSQTTQAVTNSSVLSSSSSIVAEVSSPSVTDSSSSLSSLISAVTDSQISSLTSPSSPSSSVTSSDSASLTATHSSLPPEVSVSFQESLQPSSSFSNATSAIELNVSMSTEELSSSYTSLVSSILTTSSALEVFPSSTSEITTTAKSTSTEPLTTTSTEPAATTGAPTTTELQTTTKESHSTSTEAQVTTTDLLTTATEHGNTTTEPLTTTIGSLTTTPDPQTPSTEPKTTPATEQQTTTTVPSTTMTAKQTTITELLTTTTESQTTTTALQTTTTEPQTTTTESQTMTTEQQTTPTQPQTTTIEPQITTTEPQTTTTEPQTTTTTEPQTTTIEPQTTTTELQTTTTTEPQTTTTELQTTTTREPQTTTTEPQTTTTEQQTTTTTEPQTTTTEPQTTTTEQQTTPTEPQTTTIEPQITTTEPQTTTTELQTTTTGPQTTTTEPQTTTTEPQITTTESQITTAKSQTTKTQITTTKTQTTTTEPQTTTTVPSPTTERQTTEVPMTTTAEPLTTTTTDPPNLQPVLYNPIDVIRPFLGEPFRVPVPPDTFHDPENGASDKLLLELLTVSLGRIPKDYWIQYNASDMAIYGLPIPSDFTDIVLDSTLTFVLRATDSGGLYAVDVIQVVIQTISLKPSHVFFMELSTDYNSFMLSRDNAVNVVKGIGLHYGDGAQNFVAVSSIEAGSVIFAWTNNTLSRTVCQVDLIQSLRSKLINLDGTINSELSETLAPFQVLSAYLFYEGVCTIVPPSVVVTPVPVKPVVSDDSDIYLVSVLPAVGLAVIMLLVAVLLFLLYRHRRSGHKYVAKDEKQAYTKSRTPAILPQEKMEMHDAISPKKSRPRGPTILDTDLDFGMGDDKRPLYDDRPAPPRYQLPHNGGYADLFDQLDAATLSPPPSYRSEATFKPPPIYRLPPSYLQFPFESHV